MHESSNQSATISLANDAIAYAAFRAFTGLNLFMHGAVRTGANFAEFVSATQEMFSSSWLPTWLVGFEARLIPGIEIAIGLALMVGFKTRLSLLVAFVLLATLLFGMVLLENWEVVARHMIYGICFYILLRELRSNGFSLDAKLTSVE